MTLGFGLCTTISKILIITAMTVGFSVCTTMCIILIIVEGRNVLFNDALYTFYLQLYGVRQTYGKGPFSERKPTVATTRATHPTHKIAQTTTFVIQVMEHWLEREIAQWVHYEGSIQ